jgi:hypothetical protein
MADSCFGAASVFAEKSADFETERQGDFQKSLCLWAVDV